MKRIEITEFSKDEFMEVIRLVIQEALANCQESNTNSGIKPLNAREAAAFLKMPVNTLYEYTSKHKLPFHKQGKRLYFFKDELLQWIKTGRVTTIQELELEAKEYIKNK